MQYNYTDADKEMSERSRAGVFGHKTNTNGPIDKFPSLFLRRNTPNSKVKLNQPGVGNGRNQKNTK